VLNASTRRRLVTASVTVALVSAGVVGLGMASATGSRGADRPPACAEASPENPVPPRAATVTTIGQAYYCVIDNYFSGPVLDSRSLLVPAFAALTQELQRRGLDQPDATLPALTGRKDADWAAFAATYDRIAGRLPDDAAREAVAEAALAGMVESIDDNHVGRQRHPSQNLMGFEVNAASGPGRVDRAATDPLYVTKVFQGGPADVAGVLPGDEIRTINDAPPYVNGVLSAGVLTWFTTGEPGVTVRLALHRPATGADLTVAMTTGPSSLSPAEVGSRLVDGNIAYVSLPGYTVRNADAVLAAVAELRGQAELRGIVLDLRGNGGGDPVAVSRLLGALAHGKVINYWCDVKDKCTPNRTDDTVELWRLPFVALTDRKCASACDSFSSTVKDLHLGTLVGTRTAGAVSGDATQWQLEDGSILSLPKLHEIGANREVVNTVGVAPDHIAPLTAADLSAGRDPGLDKAVSLL
jgi:carboxyl-terminal processing protease